MPLRAKNSKQVKSSQVTNHQQCIFIVQRTTAQSKTGIFRDYDVAEAPPGFQAGWSDCVCFFFFSFCSFFSAYLAFSCKFLYS
jgi:hypothetical protein